MEPSKKISSLQSLRAIAFIGILCQHCSLIRLGTWGVSVFFVLSGFILTFSSLNSNKSYSISLKENICFSASKINKLYVTHIATMFAMLLLILYQMHVDGTLNFQGISQQLYYVILNLLLLQDWFKAVPIRCSLNGVAWYLSAMTFIYFIFPFLYHIIKKYKTPLNAAAAIGASYIFQIIITILIRNITDDVYYYTYFFPPYRCFDFYTGCNVGYLYFIYHGKNTFSELNNNKEEKRCSARYTLYELLGFMFMAITIFIHLSTTDDINWIHNSLLYLPSSCVLVYLFALNRGIITKVLNNKVLVHIGDISGYTFLIHQTILYYYFAMQYKFFREYDTPIISVINVLLLTIIFTDIWLSMGKHFRKITQNSFVH